MNDFWLYAAFIAILIVASLTLYASKLLKQLSNQKKKQQEVEQEHQLALNSFDLKVLNSILLISRAMLAEQCDYSEGCWRLSVLIESLKTSKELDLKFPSIFQLYSEINTLSILEQRKKLSKQERMREDYKRITVEAKLHTEITKDLDLLQQYTIERMSILAV